MGTDGPNEFREARANSRSGEARDWTVEDVLLAALRDMRNLAAGETPLSVVVITATGEPGKGSYLMRQYHGGPESTAPMASHMLLWAQIDRFRGDGP